MTAVYHYEVEKKGLLHSLALASVFTCRSLLSVCFVLPKVSHCRSIFLAFNACITRILPTMPKGMKKYKNQPWPAPKRGKARSLKKPASSSATPMATSKKVPYVRHGPGQQKVYKDRINKWDVSVRSLAQLHGLRLIQKLIKNGMLPKWTGRPCPHCASGILGKLAYVSSRKSWAHRCNKKTCQRFVQPHDFHPLFFGGSGVAVTPLNDQASILCCALADVPVTAAPVALGLDNKPVERMYHNLEMARARHVSMREKRVQYGAVYEWPDVEVDEVDLGKEEVEDDNQKKKTKWAQWGGIVERGRPETLVLVRLNPILTKARAPGPGPIRKRDWKPIARKYLEGKNLILHSDGARTYKMRIDGVLHDSVVHQKKKVKVNGKTMWQKPHYTKLTLTPSPVGRKSL